MTRDEVVYGGGGLADKLAEMAERLATVTIIDDRDPAAEAEAAARALAAAHARVAAAEAVVADHQTGRWLPRWPMNRAQRDLW